MRGYRKFALTLIVVLLAAFAPVLTGMALNDPQASVLNTALYTIAGGTVGVKIAEALGGGRLGRNNGGAGAADESYGTTKEGEH